MEQRGAFGVSNRPDFDAKDRVKQATDVVDLIGTELNLRRRGAIYYGHCPWHDDNLSLIHI